MKKGSNVVQLTLISIGVFLILVTYFLYPKISENEFLKKELNKKDQMTLTEDFINIFENVEYKGLYDVDKPFEVQAKRARILDDEPSVVYMNDMKVILHMKDGRTVIITSDKGRYNKISYNCFFENNVKATDGETIILADNMDLLASEDLANIYNNVDLTNEKGALKADKVNYNFKTKYYKISMYDDKRVKVKLTK